MLKKKLLKMKQNIHQKYYLTVTTECNSPFIVHTKIIWAWSNVRFLHLPLRILFLARFGFTNCCEIEKERMKKTCLNCQAPFTPMDYQTFLFNSLVKILEKFVINFFRINRLGEKSLYLSNETVSEQINTLSSYIVNSVQKIGVSPKTLT